MKIFIAGSGSWGTAIASVLADNGYKPVIYGRNPQEIDDINFNHRNSRFFDDVEISPEIRGTLDLGEVKDADIVILAVPSSVSVSMAAQIDGLLEHAAIIVNLAKGFNGENYHRLSEDIISNFNTEHLKGYCALLGPSHAEEVILKMQTTINAVSEDDEIAHKVQQLLSNGYFRVYRNNDMIGAEYAAGLKNVIAIASGILYGLNLGDNAKASLMTRGLAEMTRYGLAKGGKMETFIGLCGMGDLIVTCTSPHSRNWQAGYQIGRDNDASIFWKTNTKTVEGVLACRIIKEEADILNISMPITQALYEVLYNGLKPSDAVDMLMNRQLKAES